MDRNSILQWLVVLARCFEEQEQASKILSNTNQRQQLENEVIQEYEETLVTAQQERESQGQKLRGLEREIRELEDLVRRKRQRLDQIRDNKEYKAVNDEIAGVTARIDAVENDTLVVLETIEQGKNKSAEISAEMDRLRQRSDSSLDTRSQAMTEAEAKLVEVEKEITTCLSQLPVELVSTIGRMRDRVPLPVAWLDEEACGGCHAHFPIQMAIEISKGNSVVRCQACGRYVVAPI